MATKNKRTEKQHPAMRDARGGARPGAGRPKGDSRLYTFRAGGELARELDACPNRTEFIRRSLAQSLTQRAGTAQPSQLPPPARPAQDRIVSLAIPASKARGLTLPYFEQRVVAGFPIPLDNDERSQDIDILRLLCPHPESSYLIRVQGDSMIDAGIESGDIVIVDKSRRDPSEKEIAVCELNGEYTLKRIAVGKDGTRWLVPANPDYPRFPIAEGDAFSVWGIVTYIIHKARD